MVTEIARPQQQKIYLQALLQGSVPDKRPLFERKLDDAIKLIERTVQGSRGNPRAIQNVIDVLSKTNAELAKLLADDPPQEDDADMPPLPESAQLPYIALCEVSPWITDYIEYSKKASPEGYEDFHLACALFVLSTVVARRLCIPLSTRQYTPLMLVMCARTTLFAKSTTAYAATRLLKKAGLGYLLGADETTPQKLLYDMAGHIPSNYGEMEQERQEIIEQKLAMSAQRGWYYDEFNQLVDAMCKKSGSTMSDFAGLLRKLDFCADDYVYATKGGGEDYIEKPYLTLLASTTPANMSRHLTRGAELWGDGTCARWLFACPKAHDFITATMDIGIVEPPEHLATKLQQLHCHLGIPHCILSETANEKGEPSGKWQMEREPLPEKQVTIRQDAFKAYDRYRLAMRKLTGERENTDLDGNYSRLPTFAIRVAAMIAALENNDVIDLRVWTVAQQIMETFRKNLHEAYRQTSTEINESPLEDTLIGYLKTLGDKPVTAREIQQRGPSSIIRLKSDGIRSLLLSLERSGIVQVKKEGRKEWFTLCKSC